MADLLLDYWQRKLVVVDVVHDVAVPQRVNRKLVKLASFRINAVISVKAGLPNICLEYLPYPVSERRSQASSEAGMPVTAC